MILRENKKHIYEKKKNKKKKKKLKKNLQN